MSAATAADETSRLLLYGEPPQQRVRVESCRRGQRSGEYEPVPMETFFLLICHYCGQEVKDEGLLPGHRHRGVMELHGHEEEVFIPATSVEVVRRSDRLKRESELLARLEAAETELERMRRWFPDGAPPDGPRS